MKPNLFIKNLSKVILEDTLKKGIGRPVLNGLRDLEELVRKNSDVRQLLLSKRIFFEDKEAIVKEILADVVDNYVLGILFLLIEENEVSRLKSLLDVFEAEYIAKENIAKVTVYRAKSSADLDKELKGLIQKALGKTIDYHTHIDPELLGGIKLRIDNKIIDASISHQMEVIRKLLLETSH